MAYKQEDQADQAKFDYWIAFMREHTEAPSRAISNAYWRIRDRIPANQARCGAALEEAFAEFGYYPPVPVPALIMDGVQEYEEAIAAQEIMSERALRAIPSDGIVRARPSEEEAMDGLGS
jgi:hypothetical protein